MNKYLLKVVGFLYSLAAHSLASNTHKHKRHSEGNNPTPTSFRRSLPFFNLHLPTFVAPIRTSNTSHVTHAERRWLKLNVALKIISGGKITLFYTTVCHYTLLSNNICLALLTSFHTNIQRNIKLCSTYYTWIHTYFSGTYITPVRCRGS
jgi:hypothetical protein